MLSLSQLQEEVAAWSKRNFPDNKPYHPLLGLQEEVGELAHAHLKMEQGIRGDAPYHRASKIDAVADIMIYLADYCGRNDIHMEAAVIDTWEQVSKRNWQANKENGQ